MMILEDGAGTGSKAQVNTMNQLEVKAESLVSENAAAERGDSYIIHAECHTAAAATGGFIALTNLDDTYDLEITRIYIDPYSLTPTDLICTQVFDATLASGTDVTSTALVQKNRGSANTITTEVKISDASADLTYTGGTQYHAFPMSSRSSSQRNMNGTNVLTKNKSIIWGWKTSGGGNATDGEIVSFSINLVARVR